MQAIPDSYDVGVRLRVKLEVKVFVGWQQQLPHRKLNNTSRYDYLNM